MQSQARDYALFLTRQAPTNAKWWKALAHVELRFGNYDSALVPMTIYGYLTPLTNQEKRLLADLHLQSGIPVKAAPLYEAALQETSDIRLIRNLTLALQQTGQLEKALAQLDRFAPNTCNPGLMILRADLLYSLEKFNEAASAYRNAAQANAEQEGRAWLMAGYSAMRAKDTHAGRRDFERAASFKQHRKAALLAIHQIKGLNEKYR